MEVSQPLDHVTHAVIGGGKTIDFGISDSAEFFDILSRTLYTDNYLAVVREVLCNAWDAHIAAGCTDRPIEILLDHEHLIVRDFGPGIEHAKIGPVYGVYGASTKKQDKASTGGFGLGAKAPFAYTDHFEVISYHAGVQTIYNMSKSNAVAKGKPGIIPLASFPTTEQGLRVKMPIQAKDRVRFGELIRLIVNNGEMKATLNGDVLKTIPFSAAKHGYLLTPERVMTDRFASSPVLLRYGNVIYPVEDSEEITELYKQVRGFTTKFTGYSLILQAEPDTISVTPSRESLSMQEHTVNTLKKLFKAFLGHIKGLDDEILAQSQQIIDAAVADKHYETLFNPEWGTRYLKGLADGRITDLTSMAKFRMCVEYPSDVKFRVRDVDRRVRKAAEAKLVNKHLAATFVDELSTVQTLPSRYSYTQRKHSSDWLHRRVIGKVMTRLLAAGLDTTTLYLIDSLERRYSDETFLTSVRAISPRNHLSNLPFLRKVVVVTTAITGLRDRMWRYRRHHPEMPNDGVLCYHIRSRKGDNVANALALFTALGYEVIDLTKRHSWEVVDRPEPTPRKKREPYPGLPALSNIQYPDNVSIPRFKAEQAKRTPTLTMLPTPELVLIIGARNNIGNAIDGFSALATKALLNLYGNRLGIACDKTEFNRAVKYGAKEFQPVLEEELQNMLLHSPNVAEYFAYDPRRVKEELSSWESNIEALLLIYKDPALRQLFGIPNNLTVEEIAMLNIFYTASYLSPSCKDAVMKFRDAIPLAPENQAVKDAVTQNEMLKMLSISSVRDGLKSPKRPIYLDIFTKILKG